MPNALKSIKLFYLKLPGKREEFEDLSDRLYSAFLQRGERAKSEALVVLKGDQSGDNTLIPSNRPTCSGQCAVDRILVSEL